MHPIPAPDTCPVKKAIMAELVEARERIAALGRQEAHLADRRDVDALQTLRASLAAAREKRKRALAELRWHVMEHGC
jgi:hypothetical protein